MIALVRGELAKTLTTRTLLAFLLGGIAFSLLNAAIIGAASGTLDELGEKEEAVSCLPILMLVWGLVGAAGEYRHRTAAPAALVARPGPGPLLLARFTAYGVTGLGMGALMTAAGLGLALPLLRTQPGPDLGAAQIVPLVAGNLAVSVLSAVVGAAVGAMVRNQIVGVVVLLVINFAVVPLVGGVHEGLVNLTPFGASSVLSRMTHDTTLSVPGAAAVLAAWTVVFAGAALLTDRHRDLV